MSLRNNDAVHSRGAGTGSYGGEVGHQRFTLPMRLCALFQKATEISFAV